VLLTNLLFISSFSLSPETLVIFLFEREETSRLFPDLTNDEALIIKHIFSHAIRIQRDKNNYKK